MSELPNTKWQGHDDVLTDTNLLDIGISFCRVRRPWNKQTLATIHIGPRTGLPVVKIGDKFLGAFADVDAALEACKVWMPEDRPSRAKPYNDSVARLDAEHILEKILNRKRWSAPVRDTLASYLKNIKRREDDGDYALRPSRAKDKDD